MRASLLTTRIHIIKMSSISNIQEEITLVNAYATRLPAYFLYLAGSARQKTQLSVEIILKLLEKYRNSQLDQPSKAEIEACIFEGELGRAKELMAREPEVNIEESALKLIQELRNEELMMKEELILKNQPSTICNKCDQGLEMSGCVIPENCGHMFHSQCILTHTQKYLEDSNIEVKCPDPSCSSLLTLGDIRVIGLADTYEQIMLKHFLAHEEMLTCPHCNEKMSVENPNTVVCPFCGVSICGKCRNLTTQCSCPKERYFTEARNCPQCGMWNHKNQEGNMFQCQQCTLRYCFECGAPDYGCMCGYIK